MNPNTFPVVLTRSVGRQQMSIFWGAPLRLLISSTERLDNVAVLRAEIHTQRRQPNLPPAAASSVALPAGYEATIDFAWDQLCLPMMGQGSVPFYLLVRATMRDGTREVFELGILQVQANPASDVDPPDTSPEMFVTSDALAALAAQVPGWVGWPLTGPEDPRGIRGSETFDPDTLTFWKKARVSPSLWVPLSGGAVVSPYQVTEGGQAVTEGGQAVTEGAP